MLLKVWPLGCIDQRLFMVSALVTHNCCGFPQFAEAILVTNRRMAQKNFESLNVSTALLGKVCCIWLSLRAAIAIFLGDP